jgi:hypothetical protein
MRARLDGAAFLVETDLAERGIDELTLTKERVGALCDCERFAKALLGGRSGLGDVDAMALGVLLEALVRAHVTRAVRDYTPPVDAAATLELAVELVRVEGQSRDDDPVRRRCLEIADDERAAWATRLDARLAEILTSWPPRLDEAWWPRTEEPAKLALGSGIVALSGRFDVVFGGVPTGRPLVVLELKSGTLRPHYVEDQRFYALLAALRDGEAPAAVLTCSAGDDGGDVAVDLVDVALLDHAVRRVEQALGALSRVLSGEEPPEHACWRCGRCPDRDVCPSFEAPEAAW